MNDGGGQYSVAATNGSPRGPLHSVEIPVEYDKVQSKPAGNCQMLLDFNVPT